MKETKEQTTLKRLLFFWDKIGVCGEDECWNWIGKLNNKGYGICFRHKKTKTVLAHRVAWTSQNGPIPPDDSGYGTMLVLHRCDNGRCCNPKHLFLGTQRDNIHDCMRKGRKKKPPVFYGEANLGGRAVKDKPISDEHRQKISISMRRRFKDPDYRNRWLKALREKVVPQISGENHCKAKLNNEMVLTMRRMKAQGYTITRIAKQFGKSVPYARSIVYSGKWKHLPSMKDLAVTILLMLLFANPFVFLQTKGSSLGDDATDLKLTRNLVWRTDNAKDIGASGATRPRDFFLARNATIGGTLSVTGAVTFSTVVPLASGGTNASLTAVNGGIFYSTASAGAISAAGLSGQILRSAGAAPPIWSTATYPATVGALNTILRSDATNYVNSTTTLENATGNIVTLDGTGTLSGARTVSGAWTFTAAGSAITATSAQIRTSGGGADGTDIGHGFVLNNTGWGANTGLWKIVSRNASQALAFVSNSAAAGDFSTGTETLLITPAGNATLVGTLTVSGIGTSSVAGLFGVNQTSPTAQLEVVSGAAGRQIQILRHAATPTVNAWEIQNSASAVQVAVNSSFQLNMVSKKIINVLDPTAAQDAATKNYADSKVGSAILTTNFAGLAPAAGAAHFSAFFSNSNLTSDTNTVRWKAPRAGTIKKLRAYIDTAQPASGTLGIQVWKNGAQLILLDIAAGAVAGWKFNNTDTGTVAVDDDISIRIINNATVTGANLYFVVCEFSS